jgi:hypothetical protein
VEKIQYDKYKARQAYHMALLGATEREMAAMWGVSPKTIEYWKRTKPRFLKWLMKGRVEADANVARALYKRAVGYTIKTKEGVLNKKTGEVVEVEVEKHIPPDPWSAAKWLSLRRKGDWSDTQKLEITNTNINITKIDLSGFSEEELMLARKMGLQQLAAHVESNQN